MRRILSFVAARPTAAMAAVCTKRRVKSTTTLLRQSAVVNGAVSLQTRCGNVGHGSEKLKLVAQYTHAFAEVEGRRPRLLLCSFGDGARDCRDDSFAAFLANLGFDVDIGPAQQSPAQIARQAVEADVHGIHVRVLSANGAALLLPLLENLRQNGADDVFVTAAAAASSAANVPAGVVVVEAANFVAATETIVALLRASDQAPRV